MQYFFILALTALRCAADIRLRRRREPGLDVLPAVAGLARSPPQLGEGCIDCAHFVVEFSESRFRASTCVALQIERFRQWLRFQCELTSRVGVGESPTGATVRRPRECDPCNTFWSANGLLEACIAQRCTAAHKKAEARKGNQEKPLLGWLTATGLISSCSQVRCIGA